MSTSMASNDDGDGRPEAPFGKSDQVRADLNGAYDQLKVVHGVGVEISSTPTFQWLKRGLLGR